MSFRKFFEILLGLDSSSPPPATEMQRWQQTLLVGDALRRQGRYDEALAVFEGVLGEAGKSGNRVAEATALGHIGAAYTAQNRWDEAQEALEQAKTLAESQAQIRPVLLAAVLSDYGQFLVAKGEQDAAQLTYEQALTLARNGDDARLTAHVLARLAEIYLGASNASYARRLLEEANQITHYQVPSFVGLLGKAFVETGQDVEGHRWIVQAVRLAKALGETDEEIIWAAELARRYAHEGKLHEAARLQQRIEPLLTRSTALDSAGRAQYLLERADVARRLSRLEEAQHHAEEALLILQSGSTGTPELLNRAHGIIGAVYRGLNRDADAVEHLQEALAAIPPEAPLQDTVDLRLELALALQTTDPAQATQIYDEVITATRSNDDRAALGRVLNQRGRLAMTQGDEDTALESWREAVSIFEALDDNQHRVTVLCDIASLLRERGDQKQALTLYEQALVGLNNVKHLQTRGLVLSNVANMYTDTGDTETAQAFYEEAITISRELGDRTAESLRLGNLGWFYVVTGQQEKAVATLKQALAISEMLEAGMAHTVQQNNLAMAYARMERYDEALALHQQALGQIETLNSPRWAGMFHSNMGETLARQQQFDDALAHYQQAMDISRAAGDDVTVVRTLWRLGDLQRAMGQLEAAAANYEKAVHHARQLGAQRDLAYAILGQGLLAQLEQQAERATRLLEEAKRLLTILHAPERQQAEHALQQLA